MVRTDSEAGTREDVLPGASASTGGGVTRREFLRRVSVATGGLTLAGLTGSVLTGCEGFEEVVTALLEQIANRPVRRDVDSLADDDPTLESFRAAVAAMQQLDSDDPDDPRGWTAQASIHDDFCPHANWLFLPWHRLYIHFFEEICRELSGDEDFALPYWNWSQNPRVPAAFWGAGNPLFHADREVDDNDVADPGMVGQATIDSILFEPNFLNFASGPIGAGDHQRLWHSYGPLEGQPHNYVHGFVGGTMASFGSPLDPVFWAHHNNVECLWVEWNMFLGNPNTNDPAWTQRPFTEFVDRDGSPVQISVAETLLYPLFNYRYDRLEP